MSGAAERLSRWQTYHEIRRQPDIWRRFAPELQHAALEIRQWLAARQADEIWFSGAGTSAYIGETLAAHLNAGPGRARFRSVPTTDLVASPRSFLRPGVRPLCVSFGRSGNSSETVGTLDLLDRHFSKADRLNITCNADSALATRPHPGPGEQQVLVLPPETNDTGFAMTSSYSTMLLSGLALFDPAPPEGLVPLFGRLADAAEQVIGEALVLAGSLPVAARVVFLGTGPLAGVARESALKVLELTAGQVATSWDTVLGFRHGPKAVVTAETLVVVLASPDPHSAQYDRDLVAEIRTQFPATRVLVLGGEPGVDLRVPLVGSPSFSAVLNVLFGQVLALSWSDRLGLSVDDPFAGRNLTRVVAGVRLYPLAPARTATLGAIDVGGSKIEAQLFDDDLMLVDKRRTDTRKESYEALLGSILEQADWIRSATDGLQAIGIGLPGFVDPATGLSFTSNLPATGHGLAEDVSARLGLPVAVENDCKCFALSEATGGAGAGFPTVFGLILGTGVGGGVVSDGRLVRGLNGIPGEVGHFGLPAEQLARHGLPLLRCGCGRTGCHETYVAGPGLSRLAAHTGGVEIPAIAVAERARAGDATMQAALDIWYDLLAELIHTIQLTIDADCIVLGGGLSHIGDLAGRLAATFEAHKLPGVRSPAFRIARFGDASGTRGAAILARQMLEGLKR